MLTGSPNVVQKLIEENLRKQTDVFIFDTRGQVILKEAKNVVPNSTFVRQPLDFMRKLWYDETNVKETYAKIRFSKTTGKRLQGGEVRQGTDGTSPKNRQAEGLVIEAQRIRIYLRTMSKTPIQKTGSVKELRKRLQTPQAKARLAKRLTDHLVKVGQIKG